VPALLDRTRSLNRAWAYSHAIADIKRRRFGSALRVLAAEPRAVLLFRQLLVGRARRIFASKPKSLLRVPSDSRNAVIVTKQRVTGATNGSSAYLLAIAREIGRQGYDLHLVQPSPGLFGRTPAFRRGPELDVFASQRMRSAWQWGAWAVTRHGAVWLGAFRGTMARIAARLGLAKWCADRPAPYSVALPWSNQDLLFVARQAQLKPALIIADYAFQAAALPYLLAPEARSAIVMHDLFHRRTTQFAEAPDSVASLSQSEELAMLGQAEAVMAIQATEAAFVAEALPAVRTLLVPMPADAKDHACPGEDDLFLFVGSNTAPNVYGLRWFIAEAWPDIRRCRRDAVLLVAGNVRSAFASVEAEGIRWLGMVDDLEPLYVRAGVVISPLRQGSGLKIKLVEALAQGKAVVATPTTLQGIPRSAEEAMIVVDEPAAFAKACVNLASNREERLRLGTAALAAASALFGPDRAFAGMREWLDEEPAG
jgi:succinoglycan biosynthesis protein ExoO